MPNRDIGTVVEYIRTYIAIMYGMVRVIILYVEIEVYKGMNVSIWYYSKLGNNCEKLERCRASMGQAHFSDGQFDERIVLKTFESCR